MGGGGWTSRGSNTVVNKTVAQKKAAREAQERAAKASADRIAAESVGIVNENDYSDVTDTLLLMETVK